MTTELRTKEIAATALDRGCEYAVEFDLHSELRGYGQITEQLDEQLAKSTASGCRILLSGILDHREKSAAISSIIQQRIATQQPLAFHFIRRCYSNWDRANVVSRLLCKQIENAYPELAMPTDSPKNRLERLLQRFSTKRRESLLIVIDGLDQLFDEEEKMQLAQLLPSQNLLRIQILVSDSDHDHFFCNNGSTSPPITIDLDKNDRPAPAPSNKSNSEICRQICNSIIELSSGSEQVLVQSLASLVICREHLPLKWLEASIANDSLRQEFFRLLNPVLQKFSHKGEDRLRIAYDPIRAIFEDQLGPEFLSRYHLEFIEQLQQQNNELDSFAEEYLQRHQAFHLLAGNDPKGATRLCLNLPRLLKCCCCYELSEIIDDVARVLATQSQLSPTENPDLLALQCIHRILSEEEHWLRETPEAVLSVIHTRLFNEGWTREQIAKEFNFGMKLPAIQLRHAVKLFRPSKIRQQAHSSTVTATKALPGGEHLLTGSADGELKVWSLRHGACLLTADGHQLPISSIDASEEGNLALTASWDESMKLWDLSSGRCLVTFLGHQRAISCCAFSNYDDLVFSGSWDGTVRIWDRNRGKCLHTLRNHQSPVEALLLANSGRTLISVGDDAEIRIWQTTTGRALQTLSGHQGLIHSCSLSNDESLLATCSIDGTARTWDLASGECTQIIRGHIGAILDVCFSHDNRHLYTSGIDGTLRCWELDSGSECQQVQVSGHINSVQTSADGRLLITTSQATSVQCWDSSNLSLLPGMQGAIGRTNAQALNRQENILYAAGSDASIRAWDLATGSSKPLLESMGKPFTECFIDSNNKTLITSDLGRNLCTWDISNGRKIHEWPAHGQRVTHCLLHPDGEQLLSAGLDFELATWQIQGGQERVRFVGHNDEITCMAFSNNGLQMVSGTWSGDLKIWETASGELVAQLDKHTDRIGDLCFSMDGKTLLSASADRQLCTWELSSGQFIESRVGHDRSLHSCTFFADGRIASLSIDGEILVWDTNCSRPRQIAALGAEIRQVAISPQRKFMAVSCWDHTVRIWNLDQESCISMLRNPAGFAQITLSNQVLCAGDHAGNLWILDLPE